MSKSLAIATYPLLACLAEAQKLAGGLTTPWTSENANAAEFIKCCVPDMAECSLIPEMESRAAYNAEEINAWLRERGFSIQLPPQGHLFMASILDLMVKWFHPGTESSRVTGYKGVKLEQTTARVIYDDVWPKNQYVVEIATQSNDRAYMYLADKAPQSEWEVVQTIAKMSRMVRQGKIQTSTKFVGVIFPEVQLETEPDVSWMVGTRADGNDGEPLIINCCKQEVKLKLDKEGASIKAAAAMGATRGLGPVPYLIDRPFLFWVERQGLSDPFIWSYLAQDSWIK